MPNIFPGVTIPVEDKSDIIILNTSIVEAMVGEFEKGPDDKPVLITQKEFKKYFGSIENAPNKQSYISAVKMLEQAQAVQLINVTKDAKYGGLLILDSLVGNAVEIVGVGDDTFTSGGHYIGSESGKYKITVTTAGAYGGTGEVTIVFTPTGGSEAAVGVHKPSSGVAFSLSDGVTLTLTDGGDGNLTIDDEWIVYVVASIVQCLPTGVTTKDSYTRVTAITDEVFGSGSGLETSFSGILASFPIEPGSLELEYTITTQKTISDDGNGNLTGADVSSGSINYETGVWALEFSTAPDNSTNITGDYIIADYLVALIARSKKAWSDNIGIKISEVETAENSFKIAIYEKDSDGNENYINELEVSRDIDKRNGFGKAIYVEDVFEKESYIFYALSNASVTNTYIPAVTSTIVYADGGDNGTTVTSVEYAAAVQLFDVPDVYFDLFIGAGNIEKTVIDEMITLVNNKKKELYIDTVDGDYLTVKTWITNTLNIDSRNTSTYCPNQYVSYDGKEYLCPMSALAGMKKAKRVKGGQPFMPISGIGEDRGTLNVVKAVRYYGDTALTELYKVGVNAIRYFKEYGNVVFSDWTMQRKTSATSFQSSVTTLNKMITEFEKALLVVNFKVINASTFLQLESLIDGFLKQLIQYEGTIESDYTISFKRNDDVSKDAGKVYVDLIFVFQNLARQLELKLTYTSNALYSELAGA